MRRSWYTRIYAVRIARRGKYSKIGKYPIQIAHQYTYGICASKN